MEGDVSKRIAILGGSFSPVHAGHTSVAAGILERGLANEVWLMPCRRNPLKESSPAILDSLRLQLLRLAADYTVRSRSLPEGSIRVSELELALPEPSFTCDTLSYLQNSYPGFRFRLAMGADSHNDFSKWKNFEWIERNFSPIVYPRPGYSLDERRSGWDYLDDMQPVDISSSEIRDSLLEGRESVKRFMPWIDGSEEIVSKLRNSLRPHSINDGYGL